MDHRSPREEAKRKGTEQALKLEVEKTFLNYFLNCFGLEVGRAQGVPKCTDPELLTPGHFLEQLLDFTEK